MSNDDKDFKIIMDGIIGKYYDITIFRNRYDINMNPNHFKDASIKQYNHVLLVNINGMGTGQAHFIADDGSYLLLPWGFILTMEPAK